MEYQFNNKPHTASNIAYLLLSFPLGVLYFVLLITGLATGIGTVIVWVGIPILVATFGLIWGFAALERSLAAHLLHIDMPAPQKKYAEHGKIMEWLGMKVRDSLTWKSLAYLFIKFPLGIFSFVLALTLITLCAGLILAPLGYLISTYVLQEMGVHLAHTTTPIWWLNQINIQITGDFEFAEFAKSFIGPVFGIALWIPVRALLNGLARLSGMLAHAMLTSSSNNEQPKEERYEMPIAEMQY
ncbi:hypothetical protein KSF_030040 [Reticulibacter mediterranei]|uniref:Putative sensor domain-containing protein n=1 Tax=Reticulibacter mediterranei TaxID=2778369 RepID=A0A8J3IMK0_9CHLR|nr:sensor domain-containing protein [Reticulibacter mediterranei]GHO92956.1 hypothetical protein KSF_030040 [Reticulibacter mediterranei]